MKRRRDKEFWLGELERVGLCLLSPYTYAGRLAKDNAYKCLTCGFEWATNQCISSKVASVDKYKTPNGCKRCNEIIHGENDKLIREANIQKLNDRGIFVLDGDYDGRIFYAGDEIKRINVINKNCGHEFPVSVKNLHLSGVNCPVCNKLLKRQKFQQYNIDRHNEYIKTASPWQEYKALVTSLTRVTYNENKHIINPLNLKIGRAKIGADVFHVDHIVSIRYGFDNDIPAELMSHYTNLQMLHWNDNISKKTKITEIPLILAEYIPL